jgi:hypothetical protein
MALDRFDDLAVGDVVFLKDPALADTVFEVVDVNRAARAATILTFDVDDEDGWEVVFDRLRPATMGEQLDSILKRLDAAEAA